MTDLTQMWEALARYQPYADADGHGESWRVMCEERTQEVAEEAAEAAAQAWVVPQEAAEAAGNAERADWLEWAKYALYWSDHAIKHIEAAIKERNHD